MVGNPRWSSEDGEADVAHGGSVDGVDDVDEAEWSGMLSLSPVYTTDMRWRRFTTTLVEQLYASKVRPETRQSAYTDDRLQNIRVGWRTNDRTRTQTLCRVHYGV
ncbi:unnamed protein product [Macrosiphum euphorbiae]|uniref:Uncharacterized protein n=1 Tax=Macrosiphum euphorbiae TaxID=13131 RepID=A0AAV0XLM9_9HEMI|nr:unnamed protein product [Macrosiphum euphorbiae]